jgi:hypothetical protein
VAELVVKDDIKNALEQRFSFVLEDAITYIYVRKEGIQDKEGLGGGNFTVAYSLFALLNLVSKVHYYLHDPQKFSNPDYRRKVKDLKDKVLIGDISAEEKKIIKSQLMLPRDMEVNEFNSFIDFARELEAKGLKIHETHESSHKDFSTIWSGFRNMLAHLATVQDGKGVMAYTLQKHWPSEIKKSTPLHLVLEMIKQEGTSFPPFFYVNSRPGWIMNVDAMVALIPDIKSRTIECVEESEMSAGELQRLLGFIKPS